jgi:chromosomal replication initiator protein
MQLWDNFLVDLEKDFGKETIDKWLRTLKVMRFDAANLHLKAHDSFQANWFEEHIKEKAASSLRNTSGKPIKIKIDVDQTKVDPLQETSSIAPLQFSLDSLDPHLTFENYILFEKNFLAFQIFSELVGFDPANYIYNEEEAVIGNYNPIFLHGPQGCGKTHLLMATALAMQKQKIQVLYVKAETFTEHMIKAMRIGQMALFRQTYRNSDVLIVDNIDHFSNKTATQEEFFHTFNHYHTAGKQIILSSRYSPKKLEKIEARLVSRFEWGISLDLEELPYDKLSLFFLKKIKQHDLCLTKDLKEYLLSSFTKPSHMAKALEILAYKATMSSSYKKDLVMHLDEGRKIVASFFESTSNTKLSPEGILETVSEIFDLDKEEILGKSQTKEVVFPRQLTMYLLRNKLKMPYLKIGKIFCKDHSTVISSVKHITLGIKNKESKILSRLENFEKKMVG